MFIIISYVIGLYVSLLIFLFHVRSIKKKKELLGDIQAKWSSHFHPAFLMSWIRWAAVMLYLAWTVFLLMKKVSSSNGHLNVMLLIFLFSFAKRWNVYLGSKGILWRMRVMLWTDVLERRVIMPGKGRYLVIKSGQSLGAQKITETRIMLPKGVTLS